MCGLSDLGQGPSVFLFSSIFCKLCQEKGYGLSPVSRPSSSLGRSFLLCMLTHLAVVQSLRLLDT
uniref:Uncharacterized protein n=1 Tax=Aegilops tauschii subsp. strangulata TaxID=200361 RepID=A0A453PRB2_AEGTS